MKLSIISINLNNSKGLVNTLKSVCEQTFTDFEYIVIDGGSTDGSVDIIKQSTDRIDYWISEPDKGIYNAMNKGILQAKGEYCLFLNSGDYLVDAHVLEKVMSLNLTTDIYCQAGFGKKFVNDISFYDFFIDSLKHQTMFIKTELFYRYGFYDEQYKIISDWSFYLLAIVKHSCSLSFFDFPFYIAQEGGISWIDDVGIYQEREQFLKEHFNYFYSDYKELKQYKQSKTISLYNKLVQNKFVMFLYKLVRIK